ncbi:MAG TPA: hypothetical protein VG917_05890 [Patescibacteria group bacterium]|nr:hypothetical protein [Patescibacteria group bacterium]
MSERCVLVEFCVGPNCGRDGKKYHQDFKDAIDNTKDLEGLTVTARGCKNECATSANMALTVNNGDPVKFKYLGDKSRGLPVEQLITTIKQNLLPPTEQ